MADNRGGGEVAEEARFAAIYGKVHAFHPACLADSWLSEPCRDEAGGEVARPYVWSRRNGPWHQSDVLWVGAAPGNAGGRGTGGMGAHATRIPFGGDVAGANLDALLASIGLTRNDTFITAAMNHLPASGGGEPKVAELREPVGTYPTSIHLLRDTIVAVGPRLLVALGNVALRASVAAAALGDGAVRLPGLPVRLPGLARLRNAGVERGQTIGWPSEPEPPTEAFLQAWADAWGDRPLPHVLWLIHPSAQNMSPYAGTETAFHTRMRETQAALRGAAREVLGTRPSAVRPATPGAGAGVYALEDWRERVGPRHDELDRLWREKGV